MKIRVDYDRCEGNAVCMRVCPEVFEVGFFLDFMVTTRSKPSELLKRLFDKVGAHYYDRIDLVVDAGKKEKVLKRFHTQLPQQVAGLPVVRTNRMDGFKFILPDGSWLLIRFSGTEPLIRVYAEASSRDLLHTILADGEKLVR